MRELYFKATEVAELLGISKGHAYKLVKRMNTDLASQGYITIAGRIPKRYFWAKYYGGPIDEKEEALV